MLEKEGNILVLGGTGAMGISLTEMLADQRWNIFVTSRKEHQSEQKNVTYIKGNAKDNEFLKEILRKHYDAIVDFMSYKTEEFKNRVDLLLAGSTQYIFLSSARVYAESDKLLTEESPRLLDVCTDQKYLSTDEYALAKARQEDLLREHCYGCYTIVRPSLTYNSNRLQLVISEKEEWLYRALHGRKVVLPEEIMSIQTSMAWGKDVASGIAKLIGNEKAYYETVHIASPESRTWEEVLDIYQTVLEKQNGKQMEIVFGPDALEIGEKLNRYYQIKYARGINRKFDCSKLQAITGGVFFTSPEEGLKTCLEDFLENPRFGTFHTRAHAYFDRITGERTSRKEMGSEKECVKYYIFRYSPYFKFYQGENK